MSVSGGADEEFEPLAGRRVLLRAMFLKELLLMLRYRVDFAIRLVGMYLFFAVIFFGGHAAATQVDGGPGALSDTFDGIIVGWFLWTMAQTAYTTLHQDVTSESRWGTLEHLYMSPYGFGTVMSLKAVVNVLLAFLWGFVMLVLMMLTAQRWFTVDLVTIVPIATFAVMSVLGLGFAIAGLALVYKKVGSINGLMQFVLVGLIAAPVAGISWFSFLPLVQGSAMLQDAMRGGTALWEFPPAELGLLVGAGVGYFAIGYLIFSYCERVARSRGVMGHY